MAIQDLTASLDLKQNLNIYARCKQFDNLRLILSIYDNSIAADLSNYTVRLRAMKADQVPLIQEHIGITMVGNDVTIDADEQLTTTSGKMLIELQFINKSTGNKKATFNLGLIVVASTIESDRIISTATYTLLQELENKLDQCSDFIENIGEAITANINLVNSTYIANEAKEALDTSNTKALVTRSALDTSKANALAAKEALDASVENAGNSKNELDLRITNADNTKDSLDESLEAANNFVEAHQNIENLVNQVNSNAASLSDIPNQSYITEKAKTVDVNNALALKANLVDLNTQKSRIDLLVQTSSGSFYQKSTSGTTGALLVVASGATTGQINLASITPVATGYTPVVGDYVLLVYGVASGSAELIDLRIGADGITDTSAGGSTRRQFANLTNDLVDIQNDMYSKKITQISNAPTNYAYEFVKGKEYKINIKSTDATTVQVGTIVNIGDGSYINNTPILSGTPINYDFIFRATGNAHYLYRYKVPSGATVDITIEEIGDLALATKDEVSVIKNDIINEFTNNSCSIYEFLGTKDSVLSANSWSQENGYISLTHSGDNFIDGAVAQKYVTAFNRVISYDFVPYENSIVCGYTQMAGYEYFWKQGYCVSVDFTTKTLNIHNKYGVDSNTVSKTLPTINKSVAFSQDVYVGRKFRLIIERTEDRGVKATLYSLVDYSVLATISVSFEALTIPTIGLGYDYPSFTVLSGKAELYYLGIKIKNATNCHLYIVGDSLTDGVAIEPSTAWAYMVAKSCQNTVVSGRGGATINSLIRRIEDEATPLKPKYIMVMIGTNSGNTVEKLQAVVSAIQGIGAIPIINCVPCTSTSIQSAVNDQILALNTHHVRMDIATALNYELTNGSDTSLFLSDGVHLNATGYERMYKRVLIDCPFLFN